MSSGGRLTGGPGGQERKQFESVCVCVGGGILENQVAYKEMAGSGVMSGCVTSAKSPLISESPGLSMAFNN